MTNNLVFRVEESVALLRSIFPHYPDLREQQPAPEPDKFLEALRANTLRPRSVL